MKKTYLVTALVLLGSQQALALSSIDPVQGITNLSAWLFLLAAAVIPVIFLVKGLQAMAQGERYGQHIVGLLVGLGICLAGFTIMNRWGGSGGFST